MKYSIIINTCDAYEDCWYPFFKLFSVFWPDCKGTIYLNTEYKKFNFDGLPIISNMVADKRNFPKTKRMPWSLCLKDAVNHADSELILYLQEDYFFKGQVKNDILEDIVSFMELHPDIKCIHLHNWQNYGCEISPYKGYEKVPNSHPYRMNCQPAIWRKEELLDILSDDESGWDTEYFASKRSGKLGHLYLAVDHTWIIEDCYEIIPYIITGIEGGKWDKKNVYKMDGLFKKYNIDVDFSKRGISAPPSIKKRLKNRMRLYLKELNYKY